ncbi:MAG: hypothetical protein HS113_02410 [Verrucomicrobiales bacterium]|nr:hypothetical protein [Verrucomicrobiales bacterium]
MSILLSLAVPLNSTTLPPGTHTRWVSPENPTGAKGAGGRSNRGAKGDAFLVVKPGDTAVLADLEGAGIIHRLWLSGTIPRNP